MFEIKEFYGKSILPYKKMCSTLFRAENAELENETEYMEKLEREDTKRKQDFARIGAYLEDTLWAAMELSEQTGLKV